MTTLILGHEYYYKKENIKCSPIDVDLWYDKPFTCVDFFSTENDTDIIYDIFKSIDYRFNKKGIKYDGYWVWNFAKNDSYDIIIDCTGSYNWNKDYTSYRYNKELLETILRVLKLNGIFYSYFGIYTKTNSEILLFEPKKLCGYQYI